jgi:hypothetical protein
MAELYALKRPMRLLREWSPSAGVDRPLPLDMAADAERNQICEGVGFAVPPVAEASERDQMVYVQRSARLRRLAAIPADLVALPHRIARGKPRRAVRMAALPIRTQRAGVDDLHPLVPAASRAASPAATAIDNRSFRGWHDESLPALLAGKVYSWPTVSALRRQGGPLSRGHLTAPTPPARAGAELSRRSRATRKLTATANTGPLFGRLPAVLSVRDRGRAGTRAGAVLPGPRPCEGELPRAGWAHGRCTARLVGARLRAMLFRPRLVEREFSCAHRAKRRRLLLGIGNPWHYKFSRICKSDYMTVICGGEGGE